MCQPNRRRSVWKPSGCADQSCLPITLHRRRVAYLGLDAPVIGVSTPFLPIPLWQMDWPGPELRCATYRSEEHTSELQSLMRISYAVFCLKKKKAKMREALQPTS